MSEDIKIIADKSELDDIADAVREKTKKSDKMTLGQIARDIRGIPEAIEYGTDTSDATITSGNQMLKDVTAYGANGKITGTIPSQAAKTITPTKSSQTAIAEGTYASGTVTVAAIPAEYITTADADATAADIAKDKTAYVNGVKVVGTHECTSGGTSGGIDTSDATATAEDIAQGKTAYANGEKVTGTMVVQTYYVSATEPSSSLGNDGDLCLVRVGE